MATNFEPVGWQASTPLSAKNMNIEESQYQHAKSHIDEHAHPTVYYSKAGSDAKFFRSGWTAGLDADLIDGHDLNALLSDVAPLGLIIMHKGSDEEFANGYLTADPKWHICDGGAYNGIYTPDTRGYFPRCPTLPGTTGTGGNASIRMSGTVTYGDHQLTLAEIPVHYHDFDDYYYTNEYPDTDNNYDYTTAMRASKSQVSRTTGYNHAAADEAHNHGTGVIELNEIALTPRWKSYYFIARVA